MSARHGVSSEATRAAAESLAGGDWTRAVDLLSEVSRHPAAWWSRGTVQQARSLLEEETDCCDAGHDEEGEDCTSETGCRALAADERQVEEWLLDLAGQIEEAM